MPRLIVNEFLTLDGVMQAPGAKDEDRSGGFERGGWQLDYFDDVFGSTLMEGLAAVGGFLLGRRTYEIFAAHWPKQPASDPLAGTFNKLPKYVVSTTLAEPLAWENSRLIRGDVPVELAKLRADPGKELQIIGSGELVQTLIGQGLVDEYRLMIHPHSAGERPAPVPRGGCTDQASAHRREADHDRRPDRNLPARLAQGEQAGPDGSSGQRDPRRRVHP